jgi:hypothetical protein
MINPEHVQYARSCGLSYTCAMCYRWWRQRQADGEVDRGCEAAVQGIHCAGPMRGSDFSFYEGPLTPELRKAVCFRCGEPSAAGLRVPGSLLILGVCSEHLTEMNLWRPSKGKYATLDENRVDVKTP